MAYGLLLSCLLAAVVPALTSSGDAYNYLAGGSDWPGVVSCLRQRIRHCSGSSHAASLDCVVAGSQSVSLAALYGQLYC